jgi:hypothetical protein
MWTLKETINEPHYDKFVVLSFTGETRILGILESVIQDLSSNTQFDIKHATVGAKCIGSNTYAQVSGSESSHSLVGDKCWNINHSIQRCR